MSPFYDPLKIPENVSGAFTGYEMGILARNGLI